ncbi:MAG: extradiol ring-cleavage dioxygenase [Acidimicrobiia bacterium]|nr:extradiol ring-cleavage dioxygenase [Acidimicrobiia bacterium]
MAEVVITLGVPHTPLLWRLSRPPIAEDLTQVFANFERFASLLRDSSPDLILMVASDHFRQLVTSNMPAFLVGKAPVFRATHPNEERSFGLPRAELQGDGEMAQVLLGHHELTESFDFAFSDELWLDHSFLIPLLYLTPDLDIPIVPILTNTNAPPIPSSRRFADLGEFLRRRIEESDLIRRVAIVGSGHLAYELGGPRQFSGGSSDQTFDIEAVTWMADGAVEDAVAGCSFDRLLDAGNLTFQFLNFLTCLTAAGGAPAAMAEGTECRFGNEPFFAWMESQ